MDERKLKRGGKKIHLKKLLAEKLYHENKIREINKILKDNYNTVQKSIKVENVSHENESINIKNVQLNHLNTMFDDLIEFASNALNK